MFLGERRLLVSAVRTLLLRILHFINESPDEEKPEGPDWKQAPPTVEAADYSGRSAFTNSPFEIKFVMEKPVIWYSGGKNKTIFGFTAS